MGCVSKERYHKMLDVRQKMHDGIALLKSVHKTLSQWRILLGAVPSKSNMKKRLVIDILLKQTKLKSLLILVLGI